MPRWLQLLLCLVLFKVVMLVVWLALRDVVPRAFDAAAALVGPEGVLALELSALAVGAAAMTLRRFRRRLPRRL